MFALRDRKDDGSGPMSHEQRQKLFSKSRPRSCSSIHLANADRELEKLLARYIRHVDAYTSLRRAGITDKDPFHIGEGYPTDLRDAVEKRMRKYQRKSEELLRERGVLDLRKDMQPEFTGPGQPPEASITGPAQGKDG